MSSTREPTEPQRVIAERFERIDERIAGLETALAAAVAMLAGVLNKAGVLPAQDFARKLSKNAAAAERERPESANAKQFRMIADAVAELASSENAADDQQAKVRSHSRSVTDVSEDR